MPQYTYKIWNIKIFFQRKWFIIKELIKIKENNDIVSIFCDEDDTSMFLEGYIYAIGRQDFLIKHITPHGLADGYILKKIDSVMHLEINYILKRIKDILI